MASVVDAIAANRRQLLARDAQAARQIVAAYTGIVESTMVDLAALQKQIAAEKEAGRTPKVSWLIRQERYQTLLTQMQEQLAQAGTTAAEVITPAQRVAVQQALNDSTQLIAQATGDDTPGTFNRLPTAAVENLVAALNSAPVEEVLQKRAGKTVDRVKLILQEGIAKGQHPNKVAARIRRQVNLTTQHARMLARTEMFRAYREASRATYTEHSNVVDSWMWLSVLGRSTCPFCWAQHGKTFPLKTPMATHPSCRCAMAPVVDSSPNVKTGQERFDALTDTEKKRVLRGQVGKFDALKNGDITLDDLVHTHKDRKWGAVGREASLQQAIVNNASR